jgi:hypothetical protein
MTTSTGGCLAVLVPLALATSIGGSATPAPIEIDVVIFRNELIVKVTNRSNRPLDLEVQPSLILAAVDTNYDYDMVLPVPQRNRRVWAPVDLGTGIGLKKDQGMRLMLEPKARSEYRVRIASLDVLWAIDDGSKAWPSTRLEQLVTPGVYQLFVSIAGVRSEGWHVVVDAGRRMVDPGFTIVDDAVGPPNMRLKLTAPLGGRAGDGVVDAAASRSPFGERRRRSLSAVFGGQMGGVMGLLDGLMGNASEIDPSKIQSEFAQILTTDERVEKAYQLIRDMFVFTNRRLVCVNRQGLTGSKVEYQSIPYRSITRFSVETAGHFDRDAELKVWLSGTPNPLQLQFNKKLSIYEVQAVLANYVLR